MNNNFGLLLLTGALVGFVSGYLGSFMVLKRMSLVGDALSHVALPGMALAILWGVNPMFGAFVALFFAVLGIWFLGERSEVYPEALVGVFFTASLAVGVLVTPEAELMEALFGDIEKITATDSFMIILLAILLFWVVRAISRKLLLAVVSEDLAKSEGIKTARINLIYLLAIGLAVTLGVKFVGTLLMGALVIIPAVIAKTLAWSAKSYQYLGAGIGVFSVVAGLFFSKYWGVSAGPIVVLISVIFFILSFLFRLGLQRLRR